MTDWNYELTEIAIVLISTFLLIFFEQNFKISVAIFVVGMFFCVYSAATRKNFSFKIQWHWLIVAIISGACFYKFDSYALFFVAIYSTVRFALSLIRYGETQEISKNIFEIREKYEGEIFSLNHQWETEIQKTLDDFQFEKMQENLSLRTEYEKKLSAARPEFEKLNREKIFQIEETYKRQQAELEKIIAEKPEALEKKLRQEFNEEKNNALSKLKDENEKKISMLNEQIAKISAELEKKRKEISQINSEHEKNLADLKKQMENSAQNEIEKWRRDKIFTQEEYQRQLDDTRKNFERDYAEKTRQIKLEYEKKEQNLENILAKNKKALAEEKTKLEQDKEKTLRELKTSEEKILSLQGQIKNQDELIQKLETSSNRSENKIFCNNELHKLLLETLQNAKNEVDIMSPWLNWKTKNEIYKSLRKLLQNKVKIKIAYGIENNNYSASSSRNDNTENVISELQEQFQQFDNFRVKKISSHGKIFICDDRYYVLTSMNPLSNDGTLWEEIGEKSQNKNNLIEYRKKYFDF